MFSRHKKEEPFKFEVNLTVKLMTGLPAKYKHLRMMLTRGSKAAPTRELFAANQRCEPTAADGLMTCICTMYKQPNSNTFEEKMYKISLYRINPKASMKKEKVIGATYIKLNNHVSIQGVNETVKLAMKADTGNVEITLEVRSSWQKHLKGTDGDAMSDISGMVSETASQATSNASLNSIEEDEEEEDAEAAEQERAADVINVKDKTPVKAQRDSNVLSPTAIAAVGGDVQDLKDALLKAQADLQWTNENLKDAEKMLGTKERDLDEVLQECKLLENDLEGAVRVQEELRQENKMAEQKYADLLAEVESSASKESGDSQQVSALKQEIASLKSEGATLKEDREKLRKELEDQRTAKNRLETELAAASRKSANAGADSQTIGDLEASLEKEKAKAAKFKGYLEKMTEAKGALESELAEMRSKVGGAETVKTELENSTKPEGNSDALNGEKVDKRELEHMAAEKERITMQLVTTSLAHAQAEQDRLEAKRQVYKLKDANRKLREKMTEMELNQAKSGQ